MAKGIFSKDFQNDEAMITSMIPYGDKSFIVRLFIKNSGRLSLFARKAQSIQAPSFAHVDYLPPKEGLGQLKSFDLDPGLFILSNSLNSWTYFNYLAEIIECIIPEEEVALNIFLDAKNLYNKLLSIGPHPQMIRAFELKLLDYAGFLPDLTNNKNIVAFDPISSQFLGERSAYSIDFSNREIDLAMALLKSPIDEIFCEDIGMLKAVGKLFHARLKLLGKHKLKTVDFLKQIGLLCWPY